MSKKIHLFLIASAAFGLLALLPAIGYAPAASAQTAAAQSRTAPRTTDDALASKVINDSVMTVQGMMFPRVASPNAKLSGAAGTSGVASQSCCTIGDTRSVNGVAAIDITSPYNMKKDKTYPADGPVQAIYSTPATCWVISSYNRYVSSANDPYYAYDDAQPANFNYLTSSEYDMVYKEMKAYLFTMNIIDKYKADLNLKLEQFVQNYAKYANAISTTNAQVRHTAQLNGRGLGNGRSWYHGYINVTETCCPPEVRDASQLRVTLKSWIDQTVSKLPGGQVGPRDIKNISLRTGAHLSTASPEASPAPSPTPTPER